MDGGLAGLRFDFGNNRPPVVECLGDCLVHERLKTFALRCRFFFFFPRRSPIACPRHVGGVLAAVSRFDIEWLRPLRAVSCLRFLQYPSLHMPSRPMFAARCGVTATAFFGVTTTRAWSLFIVYIEYKSKACPAVRFCFLFFVCLQMVGCFVGPSLLPSCVVFLTRGIGRWPTKRTSLSVHTHCIKLGCFVPPLLAHARGHLREM